MSMKVHKNLNDLKFSDFGFGYDLPEHLEFLKDRKQPWKKVFDLFVDTGKAKKFINTHGQKVLRKFRRTAQEKRQLFHKRKKFIFSSFEQTLDPMFEPRHSSLPKPNLNKEDVLIGTKFVQSLLKISLDKSKKCLSKISFQDSLIQNLAISLLRFIYLNLYSSLPQLYELSI
jgi:hypothetical protein